MTIGRGSISNQVTKAPSNKKRKKSVKKKKASKKKTKSKAKRIRN